MKKAIAMFFIIQLCTAPVSFAAPVVDSVEPLGNMNYSVSAEHNFIFERNLETSGSITEAENDDTNQAYGKVTIGIQENFNCYGKIGTVLASKYKFIQPTMHEYETDTGLLWGAGFTGLYEFEAGWKVAGEVQANFWYADIDELRYAGQTASNISNPEVKNHEIQATAVLIKDFILETQNMTVSPYVGVGYQYFKTETDDSVTFNIPSQVASISNSWDIENDDVINIVTGITVMAMDNLKFYVEGRFLAETAITTGLTYLF